MMKFKHIITYTLFLASFFSCEKVELESSYISINGKKWELCQGHFTLKTIEVGDTIECWHTLALYSDDINITNNEVTGKGAAMQMTLHPLDRDSIEGQYFFRDEFLNNGKTVSGLHPTIYLVKKDTLEYNDIIEKTECRVTKDDNEYKVKIEGYIGEWSQDGMGQWYLDSIPFSVEYEGELEDKTMAE